MLFVQRFKDFRPLTESLLKQSIQFAFGSIFTDPVLAVIQ